MKFVRIGLHNLCQICSFLCIISELTYAESCSWATEPEVKTSRRSELLQCSQSDTTMSCCDGDRMWAVPEFIAVGTIEGASGWGSCKSGVRQPQIIAYAYCSMPYMGTDGGRSWSRCVFSVPIILAGILCISKPLINPLLYWQRTPLPSYFPQKGGAASADWSARCDTPFTWIRESIK